MFLGSCITQFTPETTEDKDLLVVEGLITDKPGSNTIKLSKSMPLAKKYTPKPYGKCTVTITDDLNNSYKLTEKSTGTYVTDSASFRGVVGRKYKLTVRTNNANTINYTYESQPMELKPVPPIDSIYYEKKASPPGTVQDNPGCQIYLDTHDPDNKCRFYRWDYTETWEFHLPYSVKNNICWISSKASVINIKNTTVLSKDIITKYPLFFISNQTDRLSVKYSMLINQYSLNEDEYDYWSKLQTFSEESGSLYDITPASIPGNITCIEDPGQTVLGYFSVSSTDTRRFYIKDYFPGLINLYKDCAYDTIPDLREIQTVLNISVWVILDGTSAIPPYFILTDNKGCADCTVRGTTVKPVWWQ